MQLSFDAAVLLFHRLSSDEKIIQYLLTKFIEIQQLKQELKLEPQEKEQIFALLPLIRKYPALFYELLKTQALWPLWTKFEGKLSMNLCRTNKYCSSDMEDFTMCKSIVFDDPTMQNPETIQTAKDSFSSDNEENKIFFQTIEKTLKEVGWIE